MKKIYETTLATLSCDEEVAAYKATLYVMGIMTELLAKGIIKENEIPFNMTEKGFVAFRELQATGYVPNKYEIESVMGHFDSFVKDQTLKHIQ